MKMAESSPNREKTLREKEKLLVRSNFSFSHSVFKRLVLQTRKNQGLFGKGLIQWHKNCLNLSSFEKKYSDLVFMGEISLWTAAMQDIQCTKRNIHRIFPRLVTPFFILYFGKSDNTLSPKKFLEILKVFKKWRNCFYFGKITVFSCLNVLYLLSHLFHPYHLVKTSWPNPLPHPFPNL